MPEQPESGRSGFIKRARISLVIIALLLCIGGAILLPGFIHHSPGENKVICDSEGEDFSSQCAGTDEYAYDHVTDQGC